MNAGRAPVTLAMTAIVVLKSSRCVGHTRTELGGPAQARQSKGCEAYGLPITALTGGLRLAGYSLTLIRLADAGFDADRLLSQDNDGLRLRLVSRQVLRLFGQLALGAGLRKLHRDGAALVPDLPEEILAPVAVEDELRSRRLSAALTAKEAGE
jgi:hypothetical protein